ncbi:MAG: PD-(D/E)XK nuclease family protein, partial [Isosphaeraceae bacterium]
STDPTIAALRLILAGASPESETEPLIRLLRHGRFRPDWPGLRAPNLATRAAAAIRESRVFRGHDSLRHALDAAINKKESVGSERRREAIDVGELVGRVLAELATLNRPGRFAEHAERLGRLASSLGLDREPGPGGDAPLDLLWNALDDHAATLDELGKGSRSLDLNSFAHAFSTMTDDLVLDDGPIPPGSIVFATVDDARGARGRLVLLANLVEGTFPTPEAVLGESGSLSRERNRFSRVAGSADEQLLLFYPTRDVKGQELLAAGFLDDLRRSLAPEALARVEERHDRFDPALVDHEDLARSPADARVRAVALAFQRRDDAPLRRLAGDPLHREVLEGTAAALALRRQRTTGREFSRYEGSLTDPRALARVALAFGPDRPFTASQLESYLFCPFQYFMRYVLGLKPVDDRDELGEDFAGRGSLIHEFLEKLERRRALGATDRESLAREMIREVFETEPDDLPEVESGRYLIETRRLERAVNEYLRQARTYEAAARESPPTPTRFEVSFGMAEGEDQGSLACLQLGEGDVAVKVRGTIDRIDVIASAEGLKYRIIDYKTGKVPSKTEIENFDKLQLPVYALAAERLVLSREAAKFDEVGYWGLADRGYAAAKLNWAALFQPLEDKILGAVDRLRSGRFVVQPRKEECTRRCDFASVCRLRQVQRVRKEEGPDEP